MFVLAGQIPRMAWVRSCLTPRPKTARELYLGPIEMDIKLTV